MATNHSADGIHGETRDLIQTIASGGSTHSPPTNGSTGGGSSGGSGSPSGNSGHSNSGGSNNNHPPNGNDGGMTPRDKRNVALVLIGLLIVFGISSLIASVTGVFTAAKTQTPEGMAQTSRLLDYDKGVKEVDAGVELARQCVIQMRMAENAGWPMPACAAGSLKPRPTSAPSTRASCVMVMAIGTNKEPMRLGNGSCLLRERTKDHFWLLLTAEPSKVIGDMRINELVDAEGKLHLDPPLSYCESQESADNCLTYLKGKLGTPLSVTHSRNRIEISTN